MRTTKQIIVYLTVLFITNISVLILLDIFAFEQPINWLQNIICSLLGLLIALLVVDRHVFWEIKDKILTKYYHQLRFLLTLKTYKFYDAQNEDSVSHAEDNLNPWE